MVSATSTTSNDGLYLAGIAWWNLNLALRSPQRFAGSQIVGGKYLSMVRNAEYPRNTGSILNFGKALCSRVHSRLGSGRPCRPMLSKLALFELSRTTLRVIGHAMPSYVCTFTFVLSPPIHHESFIVRVLHITPQKRPRILIKSPNDH